MNDPSANTTWPVSRVHEALRVLAAEVGCQSDEQLDAMSGPVRADPRLSSDWISLSLERLQVETTSKPLTVAGLSLADVPLPALLVLNSDDGRPEALVLVVRASQRDLVVIGPDARRHRVDSAWLTRRVLAAAPAELLGESSSLLDAIELSGTARERVQEALTKQQLAQTVVGPRVLCRVRLGRLVPRPTSSRRRRWWSGQDVRRILV